MSLADIGESFPDIVRSLPDIRMSFPYILTSLPDIVRLHPDIVLSLADVWWRRPHQRKSFSDVFRVWPHIVLWREDVGKSLADTLETESEIPVGTAETFVRKRTVVRPAWRRAGANNRGTTMAHYDDPSVLYDSGVLYDAPDGPQLERKRMAKVKLGLANLSPDDVVSLANQVKTAMTGNANFTTPNPTLATLGTAITTATDKVAAQKAAQAAAKQATDDRDAAIAALVALLTSLAAHVENVSGGDAVKIASAGMSVKAVATPTGPLATVQNLSITAGDAEGRLDLQWEPVRGTKNYQVQLSTDPNDLTSWKLLESCSASKLSLTGLTSGQKVWFRVRAKAPKQVNDGAWSDPATKIVP